MSPSRLWTPTATALGVRRSPEPAAPPEYVDWDQLGPEFFHQWGRPRGKNEPEHVSVYGPSGSGKTYCITYLLTMRARLRGTHAVVVATKKADATLTDAGWPVLDDWPPDYGQNQVIWWARGGLSDQQLAEQKAKMRHIMATLWQPQANKLVAWDELPYVCNDLGCAAQVSTYYREGRANGIGNLAALQRPAGVVRPVHSEAGWTISFKPKDQDDRDRVAEVYGNRKYYRDVLEDLDREAYEFLIKHELTGQAYRSSLPSVRPTLPTPKEQREQGPTMH